MTKSHCSLGSRPLTKNRSRLHCARNAVTGPNEDPGGNASWSILGPCEPRGSFRLSWVHGCPWCPRQSQALAPQALAPPGLKGLDLHSIFTRSSLDLHWEGGGPGGGPREGPGRAQGGPGKAHGRAQGGPGPGPGPGVCAYPRRSWGLPRPWQSLPAQSVPGVFVKLPRPWQSLRTQSVPGVPVAFLGQPGIHVSLESPPCGAPAYMGPGCTGMRFPPVPRLVP